MQLEYSQMKRRSVSPLHSWRGMHALVAKLAPCGKEQSDNRPIKRFSGVFKRVPCASGTKAAKHIIGA